MGLKKDLDDYAIVSKEDYEKSGRSLGRYKFVRAPVSPPLSPMETQLQAGVSSTSPPIYAQFGANYLQADASLKQTHSRFKACLNPKKPSREVNRDRDRECLMLRVRWTEPPWGVRGLWGDIDVSPARDPFLGSPTLFLDRGNGVLRLVIDPVYAGSKPAANRGLAGQRRC